MIHDLLASHICGSSWEWVERPTDLSSLASIQMANVLILRQRRVFIIGICSWRSYHFHAVFMDHPRVFLTIFRDLPLEHGGFHGFSELFPWKMEDSMDFLYFFPWNMEDSMDFPWDFPRDGAGAPSVKITRPSTMPGGICWCRVCRAWRWPCCCQVGMHQWASTWWL